MGGHLEVLQWLREHHRPWGEVTCAWAAEGGHLGVLKWAWEHGCPWEEVNDVDSEYDMNCCSCAALGRTPGCIEVVSGASTVRGMTRHVLRPLRAGTWRR